MNNKKAIEVLREIEIVKGTDRECILGFNYRAGEVVQALDLAIESLKNAEIDNKIIKTQHDRIKELENKGWLSKKKENKT